MKLEHSTCCIWKNQLLLLQLQFAELAKSFLNITYSALGIPRKERGGSTQNGEVGAL